MLTCGRKHPKLRPSRDACTSKRRTQHERGTTSAGGDRTTSLEGTVRFARDMRERAPMDNRFNKVASSHSPWWARPFGRQRSGHHRARLSRLQGGFGRQPSPGNDARSAVPVSGTARSVSDARRARIGSLSSEGKSVREIAWALDVSTSAVVRHRQVTGSGRWRRRLFSAQEISECIALLTDGASYNEVARSVGRSVGVIARRFPGFGWTADDEREFSRSRRTAATVLDQFVWGAK